MQTRTPVDDALAAIDQPLLVEAHEDLADGARQPLVQREALALPVAGGAEAAMLILDAALVAAHPVPDALDERLAPDLMAVCPLFGQLALDHGLRGDAGVVLAGNPERLVAEHAVVADHDVFERRGDGVAEVQRAGDVGRRHADDEGAAVGILAGTRLEVAVLLPPAIQPPLDGVWLVGFGEEIHARAVPIARAIGSIRSVAGCICALLRALGELVARLLFRRHRLTLSLKSRTRKSPLRQGRKGLRGTTLIRARANITGRESPQSA